MNGIDTLAITLLSMLTGGLAVHLVNAIKRTFNLTGRRAFAASAIVALVMAVLSAVADGVITDSASADNLAIYLTAIVVSMERYYNFLEFKRIEIETDTGETA